MLKKKTENSEELYGELGRAFNFTHGDLEANRAGFMSHRQKIYYRRYIYRALAYLIILMFGVAVLLGILFSIVQHSIVSLITILCIGVAGLLYIGNVAMLTFNYSQDLRHGRVKSYEGRVKLSLTTSKGHSYYHLNFEDSYMDISADEFEAMNMHTDYRIYHLLKTKIPISVEICEPNEGTSHGKEKRG